MIIIAMVAFLSTLLNQIRTLEELRLRQNKKLEMLSKIDPLTGLVNRRSIQERCQQSESLSEEYTVILGDIDDFKRVNDTYGHDVGDEVLKAVADVFKVSVRSDDIVCRWGGEEVLVFLPRCTRADAVFIAERILERIRALEFNIEGKELLRVTMTLGVSVSSEAADFAGVTKKADERLYEGKHNGKNQVISHRKNKEIKNIS